jgi:hypothetical protein
MQFLSLLAVLRIVKMHYMFRPNWPSSVVRVLPTYIFEDNTKTGFDNYVRGGWARFACPRIETSNGVLLRRQ